MLMPLKLSDWMHWEKWPFKLIYLPLTPFWLWYCLRSKSFWFFTASNPTITFGGMEGEGKREMYDQLPEGTYPRTRYFSPQLPESDLFNELGGQFRFPLVVKPDVGMKGLWFERIDREDQLIEYHRSVPVDYLVQEWVDWPEEISIFYYRYPFEAKGTISGFIQKTLLQVRGDGRSTLLELIQSHPKASNRIPELSARHAGQFSLVIPKGETYVLSHAANHNRGAFFYNLSDRITESLTTRFDAISHHTQFYYGRYDLKVRSIDDFCNGGDFSILEFNGCGAEPNHIYDCGMSLREAYREILQHWKVLFEISRHNHQRGHRYWPFMRGLKFLSASGKHFKKLELHPRPSL